MKSALTLIVCTAGLASPQGIICPPGAPPNVKLAAKEIRRYVYLRSGGLLPIHDDPSDQTNRTDQIRLAVDAVLKPQQYRLQTAGDTLTISGGSDVAVLYGAYAFAEQLGVRFYLHGDVIPDGRIPLKIPQLDETHQPLFELRGIQPFHDFPEGPDWWSTEDYRAYLAQLITLQLQLVSTPGEIGTIANLEQHTRQNNQWLNVHDQTLAAALNEALPPDCAPSQSYAGPPRLIVSTVRSVVTRGETLALKIIALDRQPVESVTVHLRPLGKGDWQKIPATHLARAVFAARLPPAQEDFEYYVTAGQDLIWPATAPELNQTVVNTP